MSQFYSLLFTIGLNFFSFSQTEEEARAVLTQANSLEELESIKKEHPDWSIFSRKVMSLGATYNSTIHNGKKGTIVSTQTSDKTPLVLRKIIEKGTEEGCKVQ